MVRSSTPKLADDLDYRDKRGDRHRLGRDRGDVGAGHCDAVSHVTILQRSPTYYFTGENRNLLADHLRELEVPEEWVHDIVRRENLFTLHALTQLALEEPEFAKAGAHRFGARRAATGFRRGDALHAALHAVAPANRVPNPTATCSSPSATGRRRS